MKGPGNIDFKPMNVDTSTIPYLQEDKERKRQVKIKQTTQCAKNGPRRVPSRYDTMIFPKANRNSDSSDDKKNRKKKRKTSSLQATLAEWNEIASGEMMIQFSSLCKLHIC